MSWNQSIREATADDIRKFGHYDRAHTKTDCCGAPRCENKMVYLVQYSYVTGRAGRVGRASKGYCIQHADKFAERYGLPRPLDEINRELRSLPLEQ